MSEDVSVTVPIPMMVDGAPSARLVTHVAYPATAADPDPALWSGAATYAAGDRVRTENPHVIYESVQGSNLNHDPETDDGTWWVLVGPVNFLRMFDYSGSTQTTDLGELTVAMEPGAAFSLLAALNVTGADTATVEVVDPTYGAVFGPTDYDMRAPPTDAEWYEWFFDDIERKTELFVDLPTFPDATVTATFTAASPSDTVGVGTLLIGKELSLGGAARYGLKLGIDDYSIKQRDDWGNYTFVERGYSLRGSVSLYVPNNRVDSVIKTLASVRAVPSLYSCARTFDKSRIFGFYKTHDIIARYVEAAELSIDLEGLVS